MIVTLLMSVSHICAVVNLLKSLELSQFKKIKNVGGCPIEASTCLGQTLLCLGAQHTLAMNTPQSHSCANWIQKVTWLTDVCL